MGGQLALHSIDKGYEVVGFDTKGLKDEFKDKGVIEAGDLKELSQKLEGPRIIFLYVPAGAVVDKVIDELAGYLNEGDIIIDGGNSYWGDSKIRQKRLKEKNIHFVDCGTSGGVSGARKGPCLMVGGEDEAIEVVEPLLKDLAIDEGYVRAGGPGCGHYVKLVHNGIEFGMLQAIGEGMALLKGFKEDFNIPDILHCWSHGSVIKSWLVELLEKVHREEKSLEETPAYIEDTGEVNWLIGDAMKMEVPIPVISQSVMQLFASRDKDQNWVRAIAMMRHGFGNHPFGRDESIEKERYYEKVNEIKKEEFF